MKINFYDVQLEESVKVLEFPSFDEANKVVQFITEHGLVIAFNDYHYDICYDPMDNCIFFFIEKEAD